MMRALLTLWFAITSLVGPGLCCCAFPSTTRSAAATVTREKQAQRVCCRNESTKTAPRSTQEQAPRPSCPCKDGQGQPLIAAAAAVTNVNTTATEWLDAASWLWHSATLPEWLETAATPIPGRFGSGSSFLSTHDLLHVLHILRC